MKLFSVVLNGRIKSGDTVVAIPSSIYAGMVGTVEEIIPVDSRDKETDNPQDDIVVNFSNRYSVKRQAELKEYFAELFRFIEGDDGSDHSRCLMCPDELLRLDMDTLKPKRLSAMLDSELATACWCFEELLRHIRGIKAPQHYTVRSTLFMPNLNMEPEEVYTLEGDAYAALSQKYAEALKKFDLSLPADGWEEQHRRTEEQVRYELSNEPQRTGIIIHMEKKTCA